MIIDGKWRQEFGSRDLRRGEDYFYEGAVYGLTSTLDGWQAKVDGAQTYVTFVPSDGDAKKMMCSCPRFADGNLCKHLAATCMAIEEKGDPTAEWQERTSQSLDELVASVAECDLRSFLAETLHHDELLATLFTRRFGAIDVASACKQMVDQVEAAIWDYSDRGFIDWKGALGFEHAYHQIVHASIDPLVERGDLAAAVDLSIQSLRCLERIKIDDSDGFFSDAIDEVERMWAAWLKASDDVFAQLLFERISNYLGTAPEDDQEYDIYSYGADMARDFQVEHFADLPAFSGRFVALADDQLADAKAWYERELSELELVRKKMGMPNAPVRERPSNMTSKMWGLNCEANSHVFHLRSAEQMLTRWTLIRLRAMSAAGSAEGELLEAAGKLVTAEPVCQFFVDKARKRGDDEGALRLLEDCKRAALEQGDGSYSLAVSQQLAELYRGRQVDALREELLYQLSRAGGYGPSANTVELWEQVRATFDDGAWVTQREAILATLSNDYVREDCLAAEGLYERLMEEVEQRGLRVLGSHETELVERFPQRVLRLYLDDIESNQLYPGNDRKAYQRFAQRLRHIKAIPGGEKEVAHVIARMRAKYPRRPALMDELSRV